MEVADNRALFLWALRSGLYPKGPIEVDSRGRPVDPNATGYCAVGLAYDLFHDDSKPGSPLPMRKALGLSPSQFTHIQQDWNDSERSFSEIADLVEIEMFRTGVRPRGVTEAAVAT